MLIGIEATHANKTHRTGVEEVCWQLIQAWKKIIPSTMRVILYSDKQLNGELAHLPANWSVKILSWPFKKGWSQFRLSWEFLFKPPDVFLAPGQLVPVVCPKNTMSIVHDSAFRALPRAYWWASRWYLHWMNRLISKKSKLIITPSTFSKKELVRYYHLAEDKIVVVPWGYDQDKFRRLPFEQQILTKYKLIKPFIMSVSRLEEKKNTKLIVQAFNLIRPRQDLQLLLAGTPGIGYQEVWQEIINSPYKDDIIVPGWVGDDLPQLLNQAKVFVFPSFYEGFGLPILEAMACGCPVICSTDSALVDVGGHGVCYVNPNQEADLAANLDKLLNNEDYRQQRIIYGLDRVKEFSWMKAGQEIWARLSEYMKDS